MRHERSITWAIPAQKARSVEARKVAQLRALFTLIDQLCERLAVEVRVVRRALPGEAGRVGKAGGTLLDSLASTGTLERSLHGVA